MAEPIDAADGVRVAERWLKDNVGGKSGNQSGLAWNAKLGGKGAVNTSYRFHRQSGRQAGLCSSGMGGGTMPVLTVR